MNTENLLRVADAIEKHEIDWLGFSMDCFVGVVGETWGPESDRSNHSCGTTACIAGWAFALKHNASSELELKSLFAKCDIRMEAGSYFGLSEADAFALFEEHKAMDRDPAQAVRTLRYAAAHGRIDWDAANPLVPA